MSQPQVTIDQGRLRGTVGTDLRGNTFFKFQGIPYAKPPLGDLRFKAPQPPEKWIGILDATKEGDACYSRDPLKNGQVDGSENCLYLNVYTKKLPDRSDTDLKPVLFWIHGGGFVWGSGHEELYGPEFLLTEDVVLVTINYRLGLLGFISFEDPSLGIPGNAGLKDQVMALKWVQHNISKFGGNPDNVTIFGESAGGASVHLLTLSPLAKGLFHKGIAQSGCALNPWVQGTRGVARLAKALNLEGADDQTVYNELIDKSVEEILHLQEKLSDGFVPNHRRPLGVVIETNSKEAFLDDEPINIITSGRFNPVPLVLGYTTGEGMVFDLFGKSSDSFDVAQAIPWFFGYELGKPETEEAAKKISNFYFGPEGYSKKLLGKKYDLLSDTQFVYGIYVTIVNLLKVAKTPIYLYKITIETELNFFKKLVGVELPGVSHCDDVGYLFNHYLTPKIKPGSIEDLSLSKFVKLWTNFAKFGNPTPDKSDPLLKVVWKPVINQNLDYLNIGEELVPEYNPDPERIKFWKDLFAGSPAAQKVDVCVRPPK